jgi:TetR/AcrR family transcriptional repressor of mexJK operon
MQKKNRVGRPKSSAKGEAILCAAADLFLSQGLQHASMDAVAERAGVSKQTVYSHFRSKDELFRAVIGTKVGAYEIDETTLSVGQDPASALLTVGMRVLELIHDPEVVAMKRVVIAEAASQPGLAALFFDSGPGAMMMAVRTLLKRAADSHQLEIDDPRHAACVFLGLVTVPYQLPLLFGTALAHDPKALEAHVQRVVKQFLSLYRICQTHVSHTNR